MLSSLSFHPFARNRVPLVEPAPSPRERIAPPAPTAACPLFGHEAGESAELVRVERTLRFVARCRAELLTLSLGHRQDGTPAVADALDELAGHLRAATTELDAIAQRTRFPGAVVVDFLPRASQPEAF